MLKVDIERFWKDDEEAQKNNCFNPDAKKVEVTDKFFSQKYCDKCGGSLTDGRVMSRFDESCLCILCSDKEKQDPDYKKAVEADHEHIKRGNYNFPGIRSGKVK